MAVQRIEIKKQFPFSVEKLFAHMSEHENLSALFAPAKVSRLRNGDTDRNGVGSVRKLRIPPGPPFEETVTVFQPNERIEYRITRGSPLKNHHGCMRFSGDKNSAQLHYTIEFEGKVPLIAALIRPALTHAINKGLKQLSL
ncbi:MAG: SRPBCC family protein [Alcanivoracaceae bacterium]|nr:SRPBCC family protein [Alcanivoracaceae bacterium]